MRYASGSNMPAVHLARWCCTSAMICLAVRLTGDGKLPEVYPGIDGVVDAV